MAAPPLDRRQFLRRTAAGGLILTACTWEAAHAQPAEPGAGPYGDLTGREPDAQGIVLPEGFTSRLLATSTEAVPGTDFTWHGFPDGGATYPTDDGGWIYVSNAELGVGDSGVSALRFDASGEIVDAYSIAEGTTRNCAGGPTPWGTWLTCEEYDRGMVWECDPHGGSAAVALPALGVFSHEAVAVDPDRGHLYLTEDVGDGAFYRFTPAAYPDLSAGVLEAAVVTDGAVEWVAVADPGAADTPTRHQVEAVTPFAGGEGIWFDQGWVFWATKGDDRVHALDTATDSYEVVYDAGALGDGAPLRGVDNLTVEAGSGDIYVAEDGGSMQIVLLTPDREAAPFLQITGQDGSEIAGPAFSPDGTRLYFSSQRGTDLRGLTYEVTGPFRGPELLAAADEPPQAATTTIAGAGDPPAADRSDDGGSGTVPLVAGGVAVVAAVAGGAVAVRRRRQA